jgi:hypothetical protein
MTKGIRPTGKMTKGIRSTRKNVERLIEEDALHSSCDNIIVEIKHEFRLTEKGKPVFSFGNSIEETV